MNVNRLVAGAALLAGTILSTAVCAAPMHLGLPQPAPAELHPPLRDWAVDSSSYIAKASRAKAATDLVTVYRPLTPCRLFDTRGFPAALAVPGPFAPNSTTTITPAGGCGIPNTPYTKALSLAISVQKTAGEGGYIALQAVGAPVSGIASVLANEWTGTSANVSTNSAGAFDVFLSNVTAHVIIDVNGYYQDVNELDTGAQQYDIIGNSGGDVLNVINAGTGAALAATNSAAAGTAMRASAPLTGTALNIAGGAVRVQGAGVGTNTFASIHQMNTADYPTGTRCSAAFPDYTVFDHPMSNNDPSAIIIITPRFSATGAVFNGSVTAYYLANNACASAQADGKWLFYRTDGTAIPNTAQFNVLVIKP